MLRTSFSRQLVRFYASTPTPKLNAAETPFIQDLLDKVKNVQERPQAEKAPFLKKSPKSATAGFKREGGEQRKTNNRGNNYKGKRNNNNNNNNNNNGQRQQRTKFMGTKAAPEEKFNSAQYTKQRRHKTEQRYGSANFIDSANTSQGNRGKFRAAPKQQQSIFAQTRSERAVAGKRTRMGSRNVKKEVQKQTVASSEEVYTPQKPSLPDLINYSSQMAYSQESRLSRALLQFFQRHYQVDLFNNKTDILGSNDRIVVQQLVAPFNYEERLPLSKSTLRAPHFIDAQLDYGMLNKIIDRTVFGRAHDLKIVAPNDKLKLNAQVVQNTLNANVTFNYGDKKERIYKSCAGLEPVKALLE